MEPWEDCVSFSTLSCQWNRFELYICGKCQEKKRKIKFLHTIKNDFSCVYGNAVKFNTDPKFLMFLLLLLFFLLRGVHKFETVLLNYSWKLTKPETPELFMECFCVEKKKLINSGKSKPQMATVVSLWFWLLLACVEPFCDKW